MPRKPCKNGGSTQLPTNHYLETSCARPLYIFYPFLPISYCSVTELLSCFELFKALAEESFQKHFRNLNTVYPVSQSKCLFMSSKKLLICMWNLISLCKKRCSISPLHYILFMCLHLFINIVSSSLLGREDILTDLWHVPGVHFKN